MKENFFKSGTKIGIVGCGAIGTGVALFIMQELSEKAYVSALADKDESHAVGLQKKLKGIPQIMPLDALMKAVDLVVETASQECAVYILRRAVELKKDVVILSVGALVSEQGILQKAEQKGIKIYVPSGAICGVDGIGALSLGTIKRIVLTTRKPCKSLLDVPYLKMKKINPDKIKKERVVFKGDVKEAIKYFPKNINVAATLLLASSFCRAKDDKVTVYIKIAPHLKRNIHHIEVKADEAKISIEVENVPSEENPKTSTLAVLSTQYLLRKMFSSLKIGG